MRNFPDYDYAFYLRNANSLEGYDINYRKVTYGCVVTRNLCYMKGWYNGWLDDVWHIHVYKNYEGLFEYELPKIEEFTFAGTERVSPELADYVQLKYPNAKVIDFNIKPIPTVD